MSNILVVDDEQLVLVLLRRVLTEAGFNVLQASSGDEALQIAREFPGEINVLLTDLKMPGMTGQELAARISAEWPQIPAIYMSGFCDRAVAGEDSTLGSRAFLAKPFNRNTLLATVSSVLPVHYATI